MNITLDTRNTGLGFGQMQIQSDRTPSVRIGAKRRELIGNQAWQEALVTQTTSFSFFRFGAWWEVWLEFPEA